MSQYGTQIGNAGQQRSLGLQLIQEDGEDGTHCQHDSVRIRHAARMEGISLS